MLLPHPGLPEFDYLKPQSLSEASQFLVKHPDGARPFLGGTDLFVQMRDGICNYSCLVDIKNLDGTNDLVFDPLKGLRLGAAVNMNWVIASPLISKHYPLLVEACRTVASYQLRTRATIAGNICNASPAGDTIGACMILGGRLHVHGPDGQREEPLETFFLGPGKTVLKPGDITIAVTLPPPISGSVGRYIKLGRNAIGDLAIVGVTVLAYPDETTHSGIRFRIALASVAPVPLIARQAESILNDQPMTESRIAEAAQAAMDACSPIDDVRGSARYRKLMIRNLTRRALSEVWDKIGRKLLTTKQEEL